MLATCLFTMQQGQPSGISSHHSNADAGLKLDTVLDASIQSVRTVGVPWMASFSWLTLAFGRKKKGGFERGILLDDGVEAAGGKEA